MDNHTLRIKVAELRGWTPYPGYIDCVYRWQRPTGGGAKQLAETLPYYPTDLNAAWELLNDAPAVTMDRSAGGHLVQVYTDPEEAPVVEERADTACRALCLAYIAWKTSQSEGQSE